MREWYFENNMETTKKSTSESDTGGKCACKGVRKCLLCETDAKNSAVDDHGPRHIYIYCTGCSKSWQMENSHVGHCSHSGENLQLDGIHIIPEFVSDSEESWICTEIDATPFVDSQSGRRKQDYGPKVNFKKKKVKTAEFTGLPIFAKCLHERMKETDILCDFIPVELCNLEYSPDRGSAIDPHFDDFWIWGERLVTLNLLSDTILCMTSDNFPAVEIHIPLKKKSLIVLYGPARYAWKHAIHRQDISSRRLAITLRELSAEFCTGGAQQIVGRQLIETALTFRGVPVGFNRK